LQVVDQTAEPQGFGMELGPRLGRGRDHTNSGPIAYAYQPYSPDASANCGQNFVNTTNNSFGNGYFDGFSITGGHEWAEAETDMLLNNAVAWQGPGGGSDENGDKCAWNQNGGVSANITLGPISTRCSPSGATARQRAAAATV
jgi:hypothetical protein